MVTGNEELAPLDARIDSLKQSVIETVPLSNEAFEATCSSDYEEMDEVMAATTAVARQMIEANRVDFCISKHLDLTHFFRTKKLMEWIFLRNILMILIIKYNHVKEITN